jgi:hypothetical protein
MPLEDLGRVDFRRQILGEEEFQRYIKVLAFVSSPFKIFQGIFQASSHFIVQVSISKESKTNKMNRERQIT